MSQLRLLGSELRDAGFPLRVDAERRNHLNRFEPWISTPMLGGDAAGRLMELLHIGRPVPRCGLDDTLVERLCANDCARVVEDSLQPGRWRLNAYHGIIAARDATAGEAGSAVYIGEDSLRFVDVVSGLPAGRRGLDVGCGSGISSVALARSAEHVLGIDVLDECAEATLRTAALNGVEERVEAFSADFFSLAARREFDRVAANLPGVPVPPGIAYSAAGDGGPDGLARIRAFLAQCLDWCGAGAIVAMRFQSIGDDREPRVLRELREFAGKHRCDVDVVADSRIPIELRSAQTTYNAAPLNPDLTPHEILAAVDDHMRHLGASAYYSSSLVARTGGTGWLRYHPTHHRASLNSLLATPPAGVAVTHDGGAKLKETTLRLMANLPDGFSKLGRTSHLQEVLDKVPAFAAEVARVGEIRAALNSVFRAFDEPADYADRALLVPAVLVVDAMAALGLVEIDAGSLLRRASGTA
jgi:SAM-dependent methyltransferase